MKKLAIITSIILCLSALGCNQINTQEGLYDDIDETSLNKADGTENIEVIPTEGELYSTKLKDKVCKAIAEYEYRDEAYSIYCEQNFSFTVVEVGKSILYAYLYDFRPITMQLKVQVDDPETQKQWIGMFTRHLTNSYELYWDVEVEGLAGTNQNQYILDFAREAGVYNCFEWDDNPEWEQKVNVIDFDQMPQSIQDKVNQLLEDRNIYSQENDDEQLYQFIAEECHAEILKDGQIVGYVIDVGYDVESPLFDGGGALLFLNAEGILITEKEWWG
jgi:hypothetical protein